MVNVTVIVGSLRRDSINMKLAKALERLAAPAFRFTFASLGELPHYNNDLWDNPPPAVTRLKREIETADAVMFVTPEYNRAIPGLVKDVIDWASRPYGKNSWAGKPAAIIGATGGKIGTAVAQSQLRSTALVLDLAVMGQPEAYIQLGPETIAADFTVTDESMRGFLKKFLDSFADWIGKVTGLVPEPGQPGA